MQQYSGKLAGEVVGLTLEKLFPNSRLTRLKQAIEDATEQRMASVLSHKFNPYVLPLYASDEDREMGQCMSQMIKVMPLDDNLCLVQVFDVSAAKAREQQLRTQAAEYRSQGMQTQAILSSIADAVITTDAMGLVDYINPAAEEMTGWSLTSAKDIPLKQIYQITDDNGLSQLDPIYAFIEKEGHLERVVGDLWLERFDGTRIAINETVAPIRNAQGHFCGIVIVFKDNTPHKLAEQALIEAKEAAESASQHKAEFLASMSHEIRTPMNGVLGMLRLLKDSELSDIQQHHLNLAYASGESLLSIINDILDFSKVDSGKLGLELVEFSPDHLLRDILEIMRYRASEKQLKLSLEEFGLDKLQVLGDPTRIRQILTNLVGNAIKFTHRGSIHIDASFKLSAGKHWFTCSVTDTGIGIPKEKLESLFDTFTQVDASTTRRYGGTGLGLAIVKKLCHLMQGEIEVESELDRGSCFTFSIPMPIVDTLTPAAVSDTAAPEPISASDSLETVSSKVRRVLLVEDNFINQTVAKTQLEQAEIQCEIAEDGIQAINSLNMAPLAYDLILMDCQMPIMDGYETTRRIRLGEAGKRNKDIPIIALTANALKDDRQKCIEAGMSDYISKPFEPDDLKRKLQDWFDKSHVSLGELTG